MELILFDNAKRAVAQLLDFDEVRETMDKAAAVKEYARRAKDREMEIKAAKYHVYCERRAGEMLREMDKAKGAQGSGSNQYEVRSHDERAPKLSDLGINYSQSSRWQDIASIPEDGFDIAVAELEAAGIAPSKGRVKSHLCQNTGFFEWYTPPQYIEAARACMGSIDLDPASNSIAQRTVKAKQYFSQEDNGLAKQWSGNVWLNPPYSMPEIEKFVIKLCNEPRAFS